MESKESTPAYPSVGRFADNMCYQQYSASLKCVEYDEAGHACLLVSAGLESNSDKSKCQEQFDVYKECKKKEREARLERNRNRSIFS